MTPLFAERVSGDLYISALSTVIQRDMNVRYAWREVLCVWVDMNSTVRANNKINIVPMLWIDAK